MNGAGPKKASAADDIADMLSGLSVQGRKTTRTKPRARGPRLPGMRSSARVAELEVMDMLARMGMGESNKKAPVYVPSLPTPKVVDSMANLEKKKAKQLHEMLVQMTKKIQYIKNEEVVAKIRADMQRTYDAFNARYETEVQELHALKQDIEQRRAKLMGGAKKSRRAARI